MDTDDPSKHIHEGESMRPEIYVGDGLLDRHADETWMALCAANEADPQHPKIVLRGDVLSRLARDEGRVKLDPYDIPSLRERMSRDATFFVKQTVKPPTDVAQVLLARTPDELPGAPRIERVVDVPVFGADESISILPGYHPGARTYYEPFGDPLSPLDDWSTPEGDYTRPYDVEAALCLLKDELLGDFPFADNASRSHALALLLEPFVREIIGDYPTPLYLIMAPEHGTGKSLLAKVCLSVGCGLISESPPPDSDEQEFKKRLSSYLLAAPAAVWLDNIKQPLDSGSLAAALTATRWSDRILGKTRVMNVPIRNVWVATLNNPSISPELTRRSVPIFLDAHIASPEDRAGPHPGANWKHPNLPRWAGENRENLVQAAVTLVRNYLHGTHVDVNWGGEAYRPRAVGSTFLGSYERWSEVMGGVLAAAGGKSFLTNREKLHVEVNTQREEATTFLEAWHARTTIPLVFDDVLKVVDPAREAPIPLPIELRVRSDDLPRRLSSWLQQNKGRVSGGYILKNDGKRPKRWYVEKIV
jgi:putative DNA primase/helicase